MGIAGLASLVDEAAERRALGGISLMGEHGDRADHPTDASCRRLVRSLARPVGRDEQPLRLDLMPDRPNVVVTEVLADRDRDDADRCDQDGDRVTELDILDPAGERPVCDELVMLEQRVAGATEREGAMHEPLTDLFVKASRHHQRETIWRCLGGPTKLPGDPASRLRRHRELVSGACTTGDQPRRFMLGLIAIARYPTASRARRSLDDAGLMVIIR